MRVFYLGFLFLFFVTSCKDSHVPAYSPDVSDIVLDDISFVRYDHLVRDLDTTDIVSAFDKLYADHPHITRIYFESLINFKGIGQDSFYNNLKDFIHAAPIKTLQSSIDAEYADTRSIENQISNVAKYLKHYFPDYNFPNFYTFITEFGYQTIIFKDGKLKDDKDGIGIGLDMYLGDNFNYKEVDPKDPVFSDYLTRSYNKDHLVRNAAEIIVADILGRETGKRLLDQMLYNGKKLYLLDQIMPVVSDTIIMEYPQEDMEWVQNNELQIWDYFIKNKLIYETSHLKINKYFNKSPHSPGMPPEAPGRTANYIGWRIISKYMSRYPDTTLPELIAMTDSQKLMELSRYKPKRR